MIKSVMLVALAGLSTLSDAAPTSFPKREGTCKRGLAFTKGSGAKTKLFDDSPICWGYNWEAREATYSSEIEFVPLLHSNNPIFTGVFIADTEAAIAKGAKHVLSINEPDQVGGGGAGISVGETITAHQDFVQKIADKHPDVKIGSPAITNGQGEMGINYLRKFLDGCEGCRIDFLCAHWYNEPDLDEFKSHFKAVRALKPDVPVWVTEWSPKSGDANKFMRDAMAWMDGQDWIERYAYQQVDTTLTSGNTLTALGKTYISA